MRFDSTPAFLALTPILFATISTAQCLNPNLGVPMNVGDDTITACAPLGFAFPFPDGTTVTSLEIDSNGRLLPPGGDTSDFTPSLDEFMLNGPMLCPAWTDLSPQMFGDVFCFTNGVDTAVITWLDTVRFGELEQFSFQAEVRADGSFRFVYDNRVPEGAYLIGFSSGTGPTPGASDWSSTVFGGPIDTGSQSSGYEFDGFDLGGIAVEFTPNGSGGFTATSSACGLAWAQRFGQSCRRIDSEFSVRFQPNAFGGYSLGSGAPFDMNVGIDMAHTDDSIRPATLGFSFLMPDGSPVTSVDVDSNGRILRPNSDGSDFTPSLNELLNHPNGMIAPFWTDLNPASGGAVRFWTNGSDLATVTWDGVPQFASQTPLTVQIQLRSSGAFDLAMRDTQDYDIELRDLIIGTSVGGGVVDPGETDLNGPSGTVIGGSTQYELFDDDVPGDAYDLQIAPPGMLLDFDTLPVLGGSLDVELQRIDPTATASFLMLGFQNLNADLSAFGAPCILYSSNQVPAVPMTSSGPDSATFSLPILATMVPLVLQGATIDMGVNALNVELSNAVEAVTGL